MTSQLDRVPTYQRSPAFLQDWKALSADERKIFKDLIRDAFVPDLTAGGRFRPSLRVKRFQSKRGVWEMTWAEDGRATFSYGIQQRPGEPHIIWRRIGTHAIYRDA